MSFFTVSIESPIRANSSRKPELVPTLARQTVILLLPTLLCPESLGDPSVYIIVSIIFHVAAFVSLIS